MRKKRRIVVVSLFYIAAVLIWLLQGGISLLQDSVAAGKGRLVQQELDFYDFDEQFGFFAPDNFAMERWFASTDPDPQLIAYFPQGRYVTRFTFRAAAVNQAGGEMVLYYTTKAGEAFGEHKKTWARQEGPDTWVFDVGGKNLYGLRFDPASRAGVYWEVEAMTLNAPKPAWQYFAPDALQWALLLFLPMLCCALLREIDAFFK